jgi:hypothetical protein
MCVATERPGPFDNPACLRSLVFTQPRPVVAVERVKGEPWEKFRDRHRDWGRDLVLYLGRTECGLKWKELGAAAGGIDYVSASTAVRPLAGRLFRVPALSAALRQAKTHLETNEMKQIEMQNATINY